MFRHESMDRLLRSRRPDAICQIEGTSDLAIEAVDVQGDAAHTGIGQRGLQLGRNTLIGGQSGRLPDPCTTVHKCARNFDHGNAVDYGEGLAAVALVALGEIISEQRRPGGQAGGCLVSGFHFQPMEGDFLPRDPSW